MFKFSVQRWLQQIRQKFSRSSRRRLRHRLTKSIEKMEVRMMLTVLTPSQVVAAYGINLVQFPSSGGTIKGDGAGQTIAIIDPGDDPALVNTGSASFNTSDLHHFDTLEGLPDPASFTVVGETGGARPTYSGSTKNPVSTGETTLDVEWSHAIAPGANIVLVEMTSFGSSDVTNAVDTAVAFGASVVSMSFGGGEYSAENGNSNSAEDDGLFSVPDTTFIASTGDNGAPSQYPADSPNILAVGATNLFLNGNNSYQSETAWSNPVIQTATESGNTVTMTATAGFKAKTSITVSGAGVSGYDGTFKVVSSSGNTFTYTDPNSGLAASTGGTVTGSNAGGSGGGTSLYEAQPSYQAGVVPTSMSTVGGVAQRTIPDVSFIGGSQSYVQTYDSGGAGGNFNNKDESAVAGTSVSAPCFAGLVAIADQGLALQFLPLLDSSSTLQNDLYSLPATDYHDITSGYNLFNAVPGYDLVTGIGTPVANLLIPDLVGTPAVLTYSTPDNVTSGHNIVVKQVGAEIDIFDNGTLVTAHPVATTSAIDINGDDTAGSINLTLDYSGGNFTNPANNSVIPLDFEGGSGTGLHVLNIKGGTFTNDIDYPGGPHHGTILLDSSTITYGQLSLINDTALTTNFSVQDPKSADNIFATDDPNGTENGVATSQFFSSDGGFAAVNFANKVNATLVDFSIGGGDTLNVNNPDPAQGLTTLGVQSSDNGNSTINVLGTAASVITNIGGSTTSASSLVVNLGNHSSMQNIIGQVSLTGTYKTLTLEDSLDTTGRNITLGSINTNEGVIRGLAPADFDYLFDANATLTLQGGKGSNTWNVEAIGEPTTIVSNAPDTVNVGHNGIVQEIFDTLDVTNLTSTTTLNFHDTNDIVGQTVYLTSNKEVGLSSAAISWTTNKVSSVNIYGGSGGNTFFIQNTPSNATTYLDSGNGRGLTANVVNVEGTTGKLKVDGGAGSQNVYVSKFGSAPEGSMAGINGSVNVYNSNSGGNSQLFLNDAADTGNHTETLTDGSLTGLSPAPITWSDNTPGSANGGVNNLTITSSEGTNTIWVDSTSPFYYSTALDDATNGGSDIVNVESTSPSGSGATSLFVNGGFGMQTVYIGSKGSKLGGTMANIKGVVDVYNSSINGSGSSKLVLDDGADTGSHTETLSDGSLKGLAPAAITWSDNAAGSVDGGVNSLEIIGSKGSNTITVASTGSLYNQTTLDGTGGGFSTVNVESTAADGPGSTSNLAIDGGSGDQTVTIGNNGLVSGINGNVYVYNSGKGFSNLIVDDSADNKVQNVTLTDELLTGLAPGKITWTTGLSSSDSEGVEYVQVKGGSANNTYNVENVDNFYRPRLGIFLETTTFLDTGNGNNTVNVLATTGSLDVIEGSGINTVNVGSSSNKLDNIQGSLFIDGTSGNHLKLNDQGDFVNWVYNLGNGTFTRNGINTIEYTGQATLVVNGSGGGADDFYNIDGTSTATTVNAAGNGDTFFVIGPVSENLGNIAGALTLNGGTGPNTLTVNDQKDTTNDSYTISPTSIQRTGSAGITLSGIGTMTINGGSGNDTYHVTNTLSGDNTFLNTGNGKNTINVLATTGGLTIGEGKGINTVNVGNSSNKLNDIQGFMYIVGGGNDVLNINDQGSSTTYTYVLNEGIFSRENINTIRYSGQASLVINGSSGGSTYDIDTTSCATTVNAGAGNNSFVVTPVIDDFSKIVGLLSLNSGTGTLTVNDQDDTGNDTYTVGAGSIQRTGSGGITYTGMTAVTINGGSTENATYNVNGTGAGTSVSIKAGSGTNIINVTPTTKNLNNLAGPLTVNAVSSSSTLNLDDQNVAAGQTYHVTYFTVTRTGMAGVTYNSVSMVLNGGGHGNTINVDSTASPVTVNAGTGSNTINVGNATTTIYSTYSANGALTINGQGGTNTLDFNDQGVNTVQTYTLTNNTISRTNSSTTTITYSKITSLVLNSASVGCNYGINGTSAVTTINAGNSTINDFANRFGISGLGNIAGALTINGGVGTNNITVNDQVDTAHDTYTIGSGSIMRTNSAGMTFSNVSTVIINGGSSDNETFNVNSTAASTPVSIFVGIGANIINVTPSSKNLNNLASLLTVSSGNSSTTLNLDDQNSSAAETYTTSDFLVTRTGIPGVSYNTMSVVLNGGGHGNTVNVQTTLSPFTVNSGAGNDIINVGNNGHLYNIQGALTINGQGGTNTLNINDQAPLALFETYSLTNTTLTVSNTIDITYGTITSMVINGSSNMGNSGGDEFVVATMPTIPVTLNGGTGPNVLTGPNAANTWIVSGAKSGTLNTSLVFNDVSFLRGGTGIDVFKIEPTGSIGSINGGGVPTGMGDWLDYTGFTTTVSVNLATGSATNVNGGVAGSVSNIINVYGGNGGGSLIGDSTGNILVGGTGADTITGGTGRSILIADKGKDQIVGGSGGSASGGDILIGGSTSYDTDTIGNITALMALLAEWQSTDSYATRFNEINTGITGGYELNFGKTVLGSSVSDTLTAAIGAGNPAVDWFFGNFTGTNADTIVNFETGEHEDNT